MILLQEIPFYNTLKMPVYFSTGLHCTFITFSFEQATPGVSGIRIDAKTSHH